MLDLRVDFRELRKDGTITLQLPAAKKAHRIGDNVRGIDESGNTCLGFIERLDMQTQVGCIAFDPSTRKNAVLV